MVRKSRICSPFLRISSLTTNIVCIGTGSMLLIRAEIPPFFGYFFCWFSTYDCGKLGYFPVIKLVTLILAVVPLVPHVRIIFEFDRSFRSISWSSFFQNLCISNAESIEVLRSISILNESILKCRRLKVIVECFNNLYKDYFFGNCLVVSSVMMITFGYCAISMQNVLPKIGLAYIAFTAVSGNLMLTLLYTFGSDVQVASQTLIMSWKKSDSLGKRKGEERKRIESCQSLNIRLGSMNFIDRVNPIVILAFTVDQTIQLLLLDSVILKSH
jgi:hypothetical protein